MKAIPKSNEAGQNKTVQNKAAQNRVAQNGASTRLFMTVLVLSSLLAAITVDMVNPVLGLIGDVLEASKAQVSWVVSESCAYAGDRGPFLWPVVGYSRTPKAVRDGGVRIDARKLDLRPCPQPSGAGVRPNGSRGWHGGHTGPIRCGHIESICGRKARRRLRSCRRLHRNRDRLRSDLRRHCRSLVGLVFALLDHLPPLAPGRSRLPLRSAGHSTGHRSGKQAPIRLDRRPAARPCRGTFPVRHNARGKRKLCLHLFLWQSWRSRIGLDRLYLAHSYGRQAVCAAGLVQKERPPIR